MTIWPQKQKRGLRGKKLVTLKIFWHKSDWKNIYELYLYTWGGILIYNQLASGFNYLLLQSHQWVGESKSALWNMPTEIPFWSWQMSFFINLNLYYRSSEQSITDGFLCVCLCGGAMERILIEGLKWFIILTHGVHFIVVPLTVRISP